METKFVVVPFDVELAKKITNGEVEGRIVTRRGDNVRIVCWDYKSMSGDYPILALVSSEAQELSFPYSEKGKYNVYGYNMEDSLDLILEIREYMTFKNGDVIAFGDSEDKLTIGIFQNDIVKSSHKCYVKLDCYGFLVYDVEPLTYNNSRFATEEEKQKLIDALKESEGPKAKECLKILGIEQKQEYEFKPFDKVMVRDYDDGFWKADIFLNNSDGCNYMCTGNVVWAQCIHYNEQTAHLLGTTDNLEEKI